MEAMDASEHKAQLIDHCGSVLPAAALHLAEKEILFDDPTLFLGQPAHYFGELLETRGEDVFSRRFETYFTRLGKAEQQQLSEKISAWCRFYHIYRQAESRVSSEELLSALSDHEPFSTIFREKLNRHYPAIDAGITADQAGTLSSAQYYAFKQDLLTILAGEHSEVIYKAESVLAER